MFEVCCRIRNLLRIRRLDQELQQQRSSLEERVHARTRDLEAAQLETLERLAHAAEFRGGETSRHTRRVGEVAGLIAEAMGLPEREVELIRQAAPLHDVGKIGVPDAILLKPGPLTAAEFEVVKKHTTVGATILAGGQTELLRLADGAYIGVCPLELGT
jgi:putative two-component system response regulator